MTKEQKRAARKAATDAHNLACLNAYMDATGVKVEDRDKLPFGEEGPCNEPVTGEWEDVGKVTDGTMKIDLMKRKTVVGSTEYATYDGNGEGVTSFLFDTALAGKEALLIAIKDAFGEEE